ncbi:hypothetical protein GC194_13475 [bacterium]|nr:hypothetical protein [bacterium]
MRGSVLGLAFFLVSSALFAQSNLDVVAQNLLYINQEYAKYNPYHTSFRIDHNKKTLVWYNDFSEFEASIADIHFQKSDDTYLGIYCLDTANYCITVDRGEASDLRSYDMTFKDANGYFPSSGYEIPKKFEEIKTAMGIYSYSGSGGSSSLSATDLAKIKENLSYVNTKFYYYNKYNTTFDVDPSNGVLTLKDDNGYKQAPISELRFEANYSTNLFYVYTVSGEACFISHYTSGTRSSSHLSSYRMGLNYNDKLISDATTVVQKLNEIKTMFSTGSPYYVEAGLNYVNGLFDQFNDYSTKYSVDAANKMMVVTDRFGSFKSSAYDTEYLINSSGRFEIDCKSNMNCLQKYSTANVRLSSDDKPGYYMGLNYDDTIIAEAHCATRIMNNIAQIVAQGGGGSSSTLTAGSTVEDKLRYINNLSASNASTPATWSVNYNTKQLICKTASCEYIFNLSEITAIDALEYSGRYCIKLSSASQGIKEVCGSSNQYVYDNYQYYSDISTARSVVTQLYAIKDMVLK